MRREVFNTANSVLLLDTSPAPSIPQQQYNHTGSVNKNIITSICICTIIYACGGGGGGGGGGRSDGRSSNSIIGNSDSSGCGSLWFLNAYNVAFKVVLRTYSRDWKRKYQENI
jgi:hypothetical protein